MKHLSFVQRSQLSQLQGMKMIDTATANASETIAVSKIYLDLINPRHKPYTKPSQAISYLCKEDNIVSLARDIAKLGLDPTQKLALLSEGKGDDETYIVLEGNRRVCALKLLEDPALAPPSKRTSFERISASWTNPIKSVEAVVFSDREEAKIWLERIHGGSQGGIGRKDWNSKQKQRFSGSSKNRIALSMIEYGVAKGFIAEEDTNKKITTITRFVTNPIAKEVLGLDSSNPDSISRTRPAEDFDKLQKQFLKDLVSGEVVHSRQNKAEIEAYARKLPGKVGASSVRIDAEPMAAKDQSTGKSTSSKPKGQPRAPKPTPPMAYKIIGHDQGFADKLQQLGNQKMESLYYSVCDVGLKHHTPLVTVGVWSLVESLMTLAGKTGSSTSFKAFFNTENNQSRGFSNNQAKHISEALERLTANGNTTKHGPIGANFNGDDLVNDMALITPALLSLVDKIAKD